MSSKSKSSQPVESTTAAPAAVIVASASSKRAKLHKSTVEYPVARTWQIAHELCIAATRQGNEPPQRGVLVNACIDAGIATDTAKTQVQQYLKASNGGRQAPVKGPKNVVFAS